MAEQDNRPSEGNWFVRYRQHWIEETLRVFGFINRWHIERKFGISSPQASIDLQLFQAEHPGSIQYNKSSKRYEPTSGDYHG
jgi:hypothetical protein